ncbi:MAG: AAA family ATPase [Candidatus Aureabacteria bacterium]|nr:AAA family ATPase [Candidatus Auribacterota bacterium]
MWLKHLRLWIGYHWLKLIIILIALINLALVAYGIICFRNLDSFYKEYMFASVPIQIPIGLLHAFIWIFGYWYLIRMGSGSTKDSKAIPPEKLNVSFNGVIGIDEAKEECMEVVHLIKDRQRIKRIGGKIVRGLLMIGPPGCGKTLLAKAIACESKIPFLAMAGSEFNEMYVGVGASRVRKLFSNARRYANIYGSCIIFIDELDAIGRGRQFSIGAGGGETNATQNQLLVEMDGLNEGTGANVIVIGATNAPPDSLDEALLRPGRFDRKIMIDRPYAEGRFKLFQYYLGKVKYDPSIDLMRLANYTIGMSPADIENVIKESALICTRDRREIIEQKDITHALERVTLGQERKRKIHPFELRRTAVHESGHAILLYYLHPIDDVFKVSVVTRGGTLGVMHHQPIVEMSGKDRIMLEANITTSLGGYAAEKLVFECTAWGCSSDFRNVMHLAKMMVYQVGMGYSGMVGDYTYLGQEYQRSGQDPLSETLKQKLNDDVVYILQKCLKEAMDILEREKVLLEKMSEILIEKKTLEYDEVTDICQKYGVGKIRKIEEKGLLQEFKKLLESTAHSPIAAETPQPGNGG